MKNSKLLWILGIAAISISAVYLFGCTDEENPPDPAVDKYENASDEDKKQHYDDLLSSFTTFNTYFE